MRTRQSRPLGRLQCPNGALDLLPESFAAFPALVHLPAGKVLAKLAMLESVKKHERCDDDRKEVGAGMVDQLLWVNRQHGCGQ